MIRLQKPSLDSRIDELYQGPLEGFVAARQALAKTLTGDERKQVAALQKPLALPWAVNQTYWQARRAYDKLLAAGEKLRAAQVGALKGKSTDIRSAADRHAEALTEMVGEATRLAQSAGVTAAPDGLRRMFEAISTRESLPAPHGRFVKPIEAAGFEALAGIAIAPPSRDSDKEPGAGSQEREAHGHKEHKSAPVSDRRREEQERRREEDRAEAARRRRIAIRGAEKRAARALEAEKRARAAWEEARRGVAEADRALADLLASED